MSKELPKDPINTGWVLGWGVVRHAPWSLQGVFASKDEADSQALKAGDGFKVHYGSHKPGTDDFVHSDSVHS
ncbi:hypothetical protein [Pseudomonas sp. NFXW11]|uniref:hypothetical protein n=1 Tax=Pseudomonas sp. NFXW11 TaxID=2819531 RepID=UPI003CE69AFF